MVYASRRSLCLLVTRLALANASGRNWIATLRSSFVSVVWYTSPIPPDHRCTTEMRLYDRLQIGTLAG